MRTTRLLILLASLAAPSHVSAQPTLAAALDLYAAAAYDDALVALDALPRESASPEERQQIDHHRMLCLMALGRVQAAETVATALLEAYPDFVLNQRDAAPRVRAMFDATRRRVLPRLARRLYADAKLAFDDGQWLNARRGFLALDRLLSDQGTVSADPALADLRTLSEGFLRLVAAAIDGPAAPPTVTPAVPPSPLATRELPSVVEVLAARSSARAVPPVLADHDAGDESSDATAPGPVTESVAVLGAGATETALPNTSRPEPAAPVPPAASEATPVVPAATPAPAVVPAPAPVPSATATAAAPAPFTPIDSLFTYDWRDRDVVPPVALAQPVTGWWGSRGAPAPGTQLGAVDIVIDEQGRVAEARIYLSVNRVFDAALLQSVSQWRFVPATKDGRPVKYRRVSGVVAGR